MSTRVASGSTARTVPLLALAYLGFTSLGLPDGLLGVGWPSMHQDFGAPVEAVGFVLAVSTTGYLLSSVAAGFLLARVGVGWLLAASTALASLALTGYGLAPALAVVVGCSLLLGLGSGAIDSGLNAYAAEHFGARHMNWMHACFGLGATLGPLVMTGVLAAGLAWRWGYGTVALAQALLATAFSLTVRAWADRTPVIPVPAATRAAAVAHVGSSGRRPTLRLPAVWLGVLIFAIYVGIEVGTGLWAYTLLTEVRGLGSGLAGVCVSAYWGGLFVGRVLYGIVAERLRVGPVLITCMAVMGGGAALLAVPGVAWLAVVGLILLGGFAAPVFPLLMLTTAQRVGEEHAARTIGVQVAGAGLGGAVLPAGIGAVMGRFGPDALGPSLTLLAAVMIALYLITTRRPRVSVAGCAAWRGTWPRLPHPAWRPRSGNRRR